MVATVVDYFKQIMTVHAHVSVFRYLVWCRALEQAREMLR